MARGSKQLPARRKAFVYHYCKCWNATEAAKKAGYKGPPTTLAVQGAYLLRNNKVKDLIAQRLKTLQLSADEILARLATMATADLSEFIVTEANGRPCKPFVDVAALKAAGKGHLIKELSYTKAGEPIVKTHDQQSALVQLGKVYALFKEKQEVTGPNGSPLQVQAVPIDYSRLSKEELEVLLAIAQKAALPQGSQE